MKDKRKVVRLLGTLAVAAALGLAFGSAMRKYRANAAPAQAESHLASPAAAGLARGDSRGSLTGATERRADLAAELSKNLSLSTGVTRWLYWIEAIESAELADLPRLAQLANGDARATKLLGDRWIERDPRHLFDTIIAAPAARLNIPGEDLMRQLLDQWPGKDPQAVVAAVNEAGDAAILKDWRWQIAGKIIEDDAELGIRLFSDWHIYSFIPRMKGIERWAESNPRHAAEFALAHPTGYPTERFIEAIGKVWARTDPQGALNFATSGSAKLQDHLGRSVLKAWAESNLEEAGAWLAEAGPAARENLSEAFVESWAKVDPANALIWCEENLKGDALIDSASAVLKGAAEKNVNDAAKLVSAMQPSAARAYAAAEVGEKWLPKSFEANTPVDPEAVQWLAGLDSRSRARVLAGAQWGWSNNDPKGLADFLVSVNDPGIPFSAFHAAATALARHNSAEAIEWAEKLPPTTRGEAGNQVFQEWRRSQPDSAMAWFRELPATDPRRNQLFNGLIRELIHDPQGPAILAKMNESERAAAQRLMDSFQISTERKEALLGALRSAPDGL